MLAAFLLNIILTGCSGFYYQASQFSRGQMRDIPRELIPYYYNHQKNYFCTYEELIPCYYNVQKDVFYNHEELMPYYYNPQRDVYFSRTELMECYYSPLEGIIYHQYQVIPYYFCQKAKVLYTQEDLVPYYYIPERNMLYHKRQLILFYYSHKEQSFYHHQDLIPYYFNHQEQVFYHYQELIASYYNQKEHSYYKYTDLTPYYYNKQAHTTYFELERDLNYYQEMIPSQQQALLYYYPQGQVFQYHCELLHTFQQHQFEYNIGHLKHTGVPRESEEGCLSNLIKNSTRDARSKRLNIPFSESRDMVTNEGSRHKLLDNRVTQSRFTSKGSRLYPNKKSHYSKYHISSKGSSVLKKKEAVCSTSTEEKYEHNKTHRLQ